jgi:predicted NAD-dependent protein-ADP-ribosyltransferase YbiA (DUF1768 family)
MGGPASIDNEEHEETDNFLKCSFTIDNITYCSSENYFQCQKTINKEDFTIIYNSGAGISCWNAGSKIKLRNDWEKVKVEVMYTGNKAKIEQNPEFMKKLCSSKGPIVFTRSSDFWNYWNGKIFERIRAECRQNGEEDLKVISEITELMEKYKASN